MCCGQIIAVQQRETIKRMCLISFWIKVTGKLWLCVSQQKSSYETSTFSFRLARVHITWSTMDLNVLPCYAPLHTEWQKPIAIFSGPNVSASSTKFFTCQNGVKIDFKKKCDKHLDCMWTRPMNKLDVSDEARCCKFLIAFVCLWEKIFNGTKLTTSSIFAQIVKKLSNKYIGIPLIAPANAIAFVSTILNLIVKFSLF